MLLLGAIAGTSVANNYYAMPLLGLIARSFNQHIDTIGFLVSLTQGGYLIGLVFIVPLGDRISRRTMVSAGLVIIAGLNLTLFFTQRFVFFEGALLLMGAATTVAQSAISLAAALAPARLRGRAVSKVMSGLLIGVLLARTVSGLLASSFGYRGVYLFAGGMAVVLSVVSRLVLPADTESASLNYPGLLRSTVKIFWENPVLRHRSLFGALSYACFGIYWTTLTPYLATQFHLHSDQIGLVGLAGIVGIVAARLAGTVADKGFLKLATPMSWVMIVLAFSLWLISGMSCGWWWL